ncbi:HET-domain-containing protein [Sporormia fimetaria CBS 119925]|uniref:HET-domain-containing protein n=1 Tax=Sporormia fimetaria CBS 119925 TaxID=1340428 RepID=A0A6A6VIZ2_9PLEO|nr:HET-domain-containing protein [Sporormia fimetaria CBS 119925]
MEHQIYTPLPPQDSNSGLVPYSRLLELWPGEGADPFFCTLQNVNLGNTPAQFEALSYVWGREKSDDVLLCADESGDIRGQLEITRNLEQALRGLRLQDQRRVLWIDAICIRQDDNAERARQVCYMRTVYENAARVIIWLGQKDETVRRAFAFAEELAKLSFAMHRELDQVGTASPSQKSPEGRLRLQDALDNVMAARSQDAAALDALFRKEYFERVWCIQEVASSKQWVAKSEDLELNFMFLLTVVPLVLHHRGLAPDKSGLRMWLCIAMVKSSEEERNSMTPAGSLGPLLTVLQMIRNMKATNPVDRIFALLGCTDEGLQPILGTVTTFNGPKNNRKLPLIQKGMMWLGKKMSSLQPDGLLFQHPALKPNYDKRISEVYRDFARYCVRRGPRILDVLSHVQHYTDPTPHDEFPTWVPKLHEPRDVSAFPLIYMAGIPPKGHYRFLAELHDNPLLFRNIVEPNVLQAEGFRIDVAQAVSDLIEPGADGTISQRNIWSQLFQSPLFPRPGWKYRSGGESMDVAFFLTLLGGGVGSAMDIPLDDTSLPNTRSEAIPYFERQAKSDIYEWLKSQPDTNLQDYQDLEREARGAVTMHGSFRFKTMSLALTINRRVYRTASGTLGLGPRTMQPGDIVVVLFGGKFPYILRQVGREWIFIGDTYVRDDHIMCGGAVTHVRSRPGRQGIETFRIC